MFSRKEIYKPPDFLNVVARNPKVFIEPRSEIEVEAQSGGTHYATWRKQRDGETGFSYRFDLEECDLGLDPDGDPVTNCHVVNLKRIGSGTIDHGPGLTDRETKALTRLEELIASQGEEIEIIDRFLDETSKKLVITEVDWKSSLEARPLSDTSEEANRVAIARAIKSLITKGYIERHQEHVFVANTTNNEHT